MTGDPSNPYPWNPAYPFDDLKVLFERYNIICGIGRDHHFNPDIKMGLELGWGGILRKLEHYRAQNGPETREFYDSEIAVVKAIINFLHRISYQLAEFALIERNPVLKKNLEEMADINFRMADGVPATMREAIQWMCHFSMLSRLYNRGSAGGQLDQLLLPYYQNDIRAGRITDEEAKFYLGCLFFNDSRYYQLGGPDLEGNDTINHLSYLILEAADAVNIACNLTVRVHDKSDPVFLRKAVECLFRNRMGWPRFSGDKALVEGFMRCGFPREEAIRRIATEVPEMLVGAGTVLTTGQADRAIAAGAQFIVSPGFNPAVTRYVIDRGVLMMPGTASPGEMEQAMAPALGAVPQTYEVRGGGDRRRNPLPSEPSGSE